MAVGSRVTVAAGKSPQGASSSVEELRRFREPVTVLPDYEQRKQQIWQTGIFDLAVFHDQVVAPLLRFPPDRG